MTKRAIKRLTRKKGAMSKKVEYTERKAKMMLLSTGRQQALQILNFSQDLIFAQVSASQMKAGN